MTHVCPREFNFVAKRLREFFESKGFLEVYVQNRLSILAACEDPGTISKFDYGRHGQKLTWPLPQTGQMWLEDLLLRDPTLPGLFHIGTSYRDEPTPVPGRHDVIFPLFEFESKGTFEDMIELEKELLLFLGFKGPFYEAEYLDEAKKYEVKELEHEHEGKACEEHNGVAFWKNFPMYTSPFWNMKRDPNGQTAAKCDVMLHGQETFGTASRSNNPEEMEHEFRTITEGQYAQTLYDHFGQERVDAELAEFMKHTFFDRFGGGIGMTRLIRAMKLEGLMPEDL